VPDVANMVGARVGEAVVVQVVVLSGIFSQHLLTSFSLYPSPHLQMPVSALDQEQYITPNVVPVPPPQTNPLHTGACTVHALPAQPASHVHVLSVSAFEARQLV